MFLFLYVLYMYACTSVCFYGSPLWLQQLILFKEFCSMWLHQAVIGYLRARNCSERKTLRCDVIWFQLTSLFIACLCHDIDFNETVGNPSEANIYNPFGFLYNTCSRNGSNFNLTATILRVSSVFFKLKLEKFILLIISYILRYLDILRYLFVCNLLHDWQWYISCEWNFYMYMYLVNIYFNYLIKN